MLQDELHEGVSPNDAATLLSNQQPAIEIRKSKFDIRPPHPLERRLIFKNIGRDDYTIDLDCYVKNGGYEELGKAVKMSRTEIVNEVKTSGLRGRGGAGFPAA